MVLSLSSGVQNTDMKSMEACHYRVCQQFGLSQSGRSTVTTLRPLQLDSDAVGGTVNPGPVLARHSDSGTHPTLILS